MDFKNILKKIDFSHNSYLFIIILVGVAFMLFPSSDKTSNDKKLSEKQALSLNHKNELQYILSKISGVGDVEIMLTYSSSLEKSIAYEKNSNKNEKKDGDNILINETNFKNSVVMSDGEPFVIKEIYPKIQGVVVVADGADDILVRQNITDAVTTALDIAPHKVFVVKKD